MLALDLTACDTLLLFVMHIAASVFLAIAVQGDQALLPAF